jgi:hypothetical protein
MTNSIPSIFADGDHIGADFILKEDSGLPESFSSEIYGNHMLREGELLRS